MAVAESADKEESLRKAKVQEMWRRFHLQASMEDKDAMNTYINDAEREAIKKAMATGTATDVFNELKRLLLLARERKAAYEK